MNEFNTKLREAIDSFDAPPVPFGPIRKRASEPAEPRRNRSLRAVYAAAILACSAAALAVGAPEIHKLSLTLERSGNWAITTPTMTCWFRGATPTIVQRVSSRASYPIVLPTGLPANAKVKVLCNAGPDALFLFYSYPRTGQQNGHLDLLISPPAQMSFAKSALARSVQAKTAGRGRRWAVGPEEVLVLRSTLTTGQIAELERAMKSTRKTKR